MSQKKRPSLIPAAAAALAACLALAPGDAALAAAPEGARFTAHTLDKDEEVKTIYGILSCGALSCTIDKYFYSTDTKGERILAYCEVDSPCEVLAAVRGTTITYAYSATAKTTNTMNLRVDSCRALADGSGLLSGRDMDAGADAEIFMPENLYKAWCGGGHVQPGQTRPVVYTLRGYIEGGEPRTAKIFVGFAKGG